MTIENQADYRGLPHGKYVFKVRALGISRKWSRTLEFPFEIMPPWWQTWWAYATYILLAIGCIIFYIRWRERALRARQQELEVKVDEATGVIRKQKDEVEKQKDVAEEQRKIAEDQKQVVEEQKKLVEEKNHEILSSIEYAKRIQTAILPPPRMVREFFKNSFILYLPKDIVAGDFYWMESIEETIYFAACDCTGHGVPGAMVSVVCNNALNRSLNEFSEREPGKIFDRARTLVLENFSKSDEDVKDGMDASLCALNLQSMELFWAGANNPLWIYRAQQNAIEEIKADKQPIGKVQEEKNFTTHRIALYHGDIIYLFTDGYADQFGGEKNKKLTKAKFRDLLLSMAALSMEEQRTKLLAFHDTYRGSNEQVDDICLMGVRV
jgi:serine phosphatase RsbU (regulator of sigma subunit)